MEVKAAGLEETLGDLKMKHTTEVMALLKNISGLGGKVAILAEGAKGAQAGAVASPAATSGDLLINIHSESTVQTWADHFKGTVVHAGSITVACGRGRTGTKPCDAGRVSKILGGVKTILGGLTVDGCVVGKLDLAGLERVGGDLTFQHAIRLESAAFPSLKVVAGSLAVGFDVSDRGRTQLTSLAAPSLVTVGGSFTVTYAMKLATLTLPKLETVAGACRCNRRPHPRALAHLCGLCRCPCACGGSHAPTNPTASARLTPHSRPFARAFTLGVTCQAPSC